MPPAQNPPTLPSTVLVLATFTVVAAMIAAWVTAIARLGRGEPLIPGRPPRVIPWGPGSVLAAIVLSVLINLAVVSGYLAAMGPVKVIAPAMQLVLIAVNNAVLIAALPLLLRLTSGARPGDFGLGTTPARADAILGVFGYLLVAPVIFALMGVAVRVWPPQAHPLQKMLEADTGGAIALLAFLSGVVLAPAAEELLFRGIILGGLVRAFSGAMPAPDPTIKLIEPGDVELLPSDSIATIEDFGNPWSAPQAPPDARRGNPVPRAGLMANVLTSVLFATLHYAQWPAPIPLFFLSLALGWLYLRTGGLIAPFAMHATFNGMSTAILYLHLLTVTKPPGDAVRPAAVACRESGDFHPIPALASPGGRGMLLDPFPSSHGDHRHAAEAGPGRGR